jgi:hypothetical protein
VRIRRRYDITAGQVAVLQAMDHLQPAREAVSHAVDRLSAAGARDEVLASLMHRRLRGDAFVRIGRVWRLGVLLLGRSGTLYATGTTFRIDELKFDNHQSNLAAVRREYRAAALRAGFPAGETINFGARPIELDAVPLDAGLPDAGLPDAALPDAALPDAALPDAAPGASGASGGPVILTPEGLQVRWSPTSDALAPFASYLAERAELLADPPTGA